MMEIVQENGKVLQKKIDFAVIFSVQGANPNGDPLDGNRPRRNYCDKGEVSDVCIKRKIRNRLMEAGYPIFVQSRDNRMDGYQSLQERAKGELGSIKSEEGKKAACEKWIDVRAFGQVFGWAEEEKEGCAIGIRGPVSVHPAFSVMPIGDRIHSMQITKSVNGKKGKGEKKTSDTMGMKHRVDHGVYVFYGAINPQLASKTSFSDEDANAIKEALQHLFDNDASSARPEGSMEVIAVFWWEHASKHGEYSSAKVHRSLSVRVKEGIKDPESIEDYSIRLETLPGLEPEIFTPSDNDIVIERV